MKTLGWITTAALTIGLGMATPAMARDEHGRTDNVRTTRVEQRDVRSDRTVEIRHDVIQRDTVIHDRPTFVNRERIIERPVFVDQRVVEVAPTPVYAAVDCTEPVGIAGLPACVIDTITLQGRGPIDSVQFVQANGLQYYNVVVGRGGPHFDLHIDLGGGLLSLSPC